MNQKWNSWQESPSLCKQSSGWKLQTFAEMSVGFPFLRCFEFVIGISITSMTPKDESGTLNHIIYKFIYRLIYVYQIASQPATVAVGMSAIPNPKHPVHPWKRSCLCIMQEAPRTIHVHDGWAWMSGKKHESWEPKGMCQVFESFNFLDVGTWWKTRHPWGTLF